MFAFRSAWRLPGHLLCGLAVPGLLVVTGDLLQRRGAAGPATLPPPTAVSPQLPPPGLPVLDLPACRSLALTHQPAIAAALTSLDAAVARQHALDTIRVPRFLARDLPTRKEQAAVGLGIAQAEVQRVQIDTLYAVTYAYLSAQYAVEQRRLLDGSREKLDNLLEGIKAGLEAGKTNIRKEDVQRVETYQLLVRSRQEEAIQGEQRALSALREALGVGPHMPLLLSASGQFRVQPLVHKESVVAEALARRPEILQASLLAQVHGLEVDAQAARKHLPQVPTFASGSDLHSRPLPAGSYGEQYSPAAVGPEMPGTLAGNQASRVQVAQVYAHRADTVLEKTRQLIRLETEQAYLRYLEASRKLPSLIEAAKKAQVVFDAVNASFRKGLRTSTTAQDWLNAGSLVTELRSQVNTTRYHMLIALAGLERATAGAFCAGFEKAPTSDPSDRDEKNDKDKKDRDKEKNSDKDKNDKNKNGTN
jgi:outer membrane protein TolC